MKPKYVEINERLRKEIENNRIKVLSERHIIHKFNVSSITARRVLNDLEDEGYIERKVGKGSIVIEKINEVGVISYDIREAFNSFIPEIIEGIEEEAEKERYYIHLYTTRRKSIIQTKSSLYHLIDKRKLSGVLILSPLPEDDIRFLKERDIPFVVIANYYPDIKCSYVIYDYKGITKQICRMLYRRGKRRIGILISQKGEYGTKRSGDLMYEGYEGFLKEEGIKDGTILEMKGRINMRELIDAMKKVDSMIIGSTIVSDNVLRRKMGGNFILYTHKDVDDPRVVYFPLKDYGKIGFDVLNRLIKGEKGDIKVILKPDMKWKGGDEKRKGVFNKGEIALVSRR